MSALAFLALAVAFSVLGTLVLWARNRSSDAPDATIAEFRSKMRALSEDEGDSISGGRGRRGA